MTGLWCESAWIDGSPKNSVAIDFDSDGRISAVLPQTLPGDRTRLGGVVFPGFANAHSHAFHRALRGSEGAGGDFWAWREVMYRLADTLTPDSYLALATSVYEEMVRAGFTIVGEFHYLHHQPGGGRYANPNEMGETLIEAARRAGIRMTLLDACYLQGGIGVDLSPSQRRFSDGNVDSWLERHQHLRPDATSKIGAAIHSVRAMSPDQIAELTRSVTKGPLHVHLAEQLAERESTLARLGATPTQLLAQAGVLHPSTTCVHGIHLDLDDIELIVASGAGVCACPTTEADLGDGTGPFPALVEQGVALSIGTDQHSSIDPFEEITRLELDQRLAHRRRGVFDPGSLIDVLTVNGYQALGWDDGGRIAPGFLCDLVAIDGDSPRTAGSDSSMLPMTARAADVVAVVVGGRLVVG